jgi:outer membrane protein
MESLSTITCVFCILAVTLLASCTQTKTLSQLETSAGSLESKPYIQTESTPIDPGETYVLTLETAIDRALVANRGLISVGEQVDSSRLSLVAAESQFELKFKPRANAGFGDHSTNGVEEKYGAGLTIDKRFESGTTLAVTPRVDRVEGGFQQGADVSLTQPLLLGTSSEYVLSSVDSAEFSLRASKRSLFLTRVNTVVSTVMLVYRVVQQRELVMLNKLSVERLTGLVAATKAKEKIGIATPIDVLRGEWQLRFAMDTLLTAKESFGDYLDDLRFQLALPQDQPIEVQAPLVYDEFVMDEHEAISIALHNRVELDQAQDMVLESERQSRIAKHRTLPQLDLVFGYSQVGVNENLVNDFGIDDHVWNVNLVTTSDLARTAEYAAYEQSLLGVGAAERSYEMQRDDIARQAKRELRNLRRSEKRIAIQKEQIKNSEAAMRLAKIKFNHGLGNNFDLVEAEKDLRQAEVDLVSAVVEYIVGNYKMRQSLGTLIEKPEGI